MPETVAADAFRVDALVVVAVPLAPQDASTSAVAISAPTPARCRLRGCVLLLSLFIDPSSSSSSKRWGAVCSPAEIDHRSGERVSMRSLVTPSRPHAPTRQRAQVGGEGAGDDGRRRAVLDQQAQVIAGAQVGDARRGGVIAAHTLVPDLCGRHHQAGVARAAGANAPVDFLAVDEEALVQQADLPEGAPPQ